MVVPISTGLMSSIRGDMLSAYTVTTVYYKYLEPRGLGSYNIHDSSTHLIVVPSRVVCAPMPNPLQHLIPIAQLSRFPYLYYPVGREKAAISVFNIS